MRRCVISLFMVTSMLLVFASSIRAQQSDVLTQQLTEIETLVQEIRALDTEVERTWINTGNLQFTVAEATRSEYDEQVAADMALLNYAFHWTLQLEPAQFPELPLPTTDLYDYRTQTLYVIEQEPMMSPMREVLYSLTYAQALVDQQLEVGHLLDTDGSLDQELASAALVNGDVYFTMQLFLERWFALHPERADEILQMGAVSYQRDALNRVLPFTRESEFFTYRRGADFVRAVYSAGGWEAVNALYEQPPVSTEQILHPELYQSGHLPQQVELDSWESDTFELVMEDTLGEFGIYQHLGTALDPLQSQIAAAGWGGDHFQLYANPANPAQFILIWRLAWDTETDAAEFAETYDNYIEARFAIIPVSVSENVLCWNTFPAVCLVSDRQQSLVIYAPDAGTAQTIVEFYLPLEP